MIRRYSRPRTLSPGWTRPSTRCAGFTTMPSPPAVIVSSTGTVCRRLPRTSCGLSGQLAALLVPLLVAQRGGVRRRDTGAAHRADEHLGDPQVAVPVPRSLLLGRRHGGRLAGQPLCPSEAASAAARSSCTIRSGSSAA